MLVLVRHGQTDANARGLLLGRADPSLSDLGRAQARALAAMVPADARVVASPLARTVETATAFGRPVDVDERWIELDYGTFDGRPIGEVPGRDLAALAERSRFRARGRRIDRGPRRARPRRVRRPRRGSPRDAT